MICARMCVFLVCIMVFARALLGYVKDTCVYACVCLCVRKNMRMLTVHGWREKCVMFDDSWSKELYHTVKHLRRERKH